ncbi:MAG: recombinase family protein, partial [Rhodanobacter sp.]
MRIAAYARYSSDSQREASLDDQLRNCRAYCARQSWPAPIVYTDAATSGARNDRPGYLKMLAELSRYDA